MASAHAASTAGTCSTTRRTGAVTATTRLTLSGPASTGSASCGARTACSTTACPTRRVTTPTRALATPARNVSVCAGRPCWVCRCWRPVCAATRRCTCATAAAWPAAAAGESTKPSAEPPSPPPERTLRRPLRTLALRREGWKYQTRAARQSFFFNFLFWFYMKNIYI